MADRASPGQAADLLTVDCGNSTVDCMRHADGARRSLPAAALDGADLRAFATGVPGIRRVAIVSVVPAIVPGLLATLRATGLVVRVAGAELPCPLPIAYETPETLGADRWVGALAAHRAHGRAVVVDCGTATTVNLVDADGTFRGGAIAPGLRAFSAGLAAVTPALPPPDLDAAPAMPPRSTQAAVDTGVLLGWCGLVERLVAGALRTAGGPSRVVVTGGNAPRLLRHTRLVAVHEPDLVHRGLMLLAEGARWSG